MYVMPLADKHADAPGPVSDATSKRGRDDIDRNSPKSLSAAAHLPM
jgi:hypothetical protein